MQQTLLLIRRTRAGDGDAGNELFLRYAKPLERFVRARVHQTADADEVLQEAQMRAVAAVHAPSGFEYRGIGSFWAFLRQIARNMIIEQARRGGRRGRMAVLPDESWNAPKAPQAPILSKLIGKEQLDAFERALEKESEQHRNAVLMRLELNLGYREIAAECRFPGEDAARMAIHRALERIAQEMSRGHRPE